MKSYSSREVIQILKADGRYEAACAGDHHQFKYHAKKGKVTVVHPRNNMPVFLIKSIERQANIKLPR